MSQVDMLVWKDRQLAHYLEERNIAALAVAAALTHLHAGLAEQGWSRVRNPDSLIDYVLDEFELLVVGGTLVAYTIGEAWFLEGEVLCEEFIAPVGSPAPLQDVVDALTAIGKQRGCSRLMLGTRANPRQLGLARLFQMTGMNLSTYELTKEL